MPGQEGSSSHWGGMDSRYGCGVWLAVCLLLVQRPTATSSAHVAFPNDVLASLGNLHRASSHVKYTHDSKTPSPSKGIAHTTLLSPSVSAPTRHTSPEEQFYVDIHENTEDLAQTPLGRIYSSEPETEDYKDDVDDIDRANQLNHVEALSPSESDIEVSRWPAKQQYSEDYEDSQSAGVSQVGSTHAGDGHKTPYHEHVSTEMSPPLYQPEEKAESMAEGKGKDGKKPPCRGCQLREGDRAYRIEVLKQTILSKLHLTFMPNRTRAFVPKALAQMAGIHTDLMQDSPYGGVEHQYHDDEDEEDTEYSQPERVFTSAKPLPSEWTRRSANHNGCYFSMPSEVLRSRVQKAYLWFYVRHVKNAQVPVVQMTVTRLGPPGKTSRVRTSKNVVWTHKEYPEKASGWKQVDLTSVVRRWASNPSSNYGLEIVAHNSHENLVVVPPAASQFAGYEPTLDISISNEVKRRYRRSDSLVCNENSTEERCCRYPLTVSFAEFGWEWVIAPTHVKADFCSGECRMTLQNKSPYSWIASQSTSSGGSCCTPSKMAAQSLLYFDQNGDIVFQMLQNMKVEKCGCT